MYSLGSNISTATGGKQRNTIFRRNANTKATKSDSFGGAQRKFSGIEATSKGIASSALSTTLAHFIILPHFSFPRYLHIRPVKFGKSTAVRMIRESLLRASVL